MRGLCVVILRIENPCVGGSIPPQATITTSTKVRGSLKSLKSLALKAFFMPIGLCILHKSQGFPRAIKSNPHRIIFNGSFDQINILTDEVACMSKVIITCAVTGAIHTPSMSPYLPVTPEEIIEASVGAAEAGAAIIHLHARDPVTGKPDQSPEAFAKFLPQIKARTNAVINLTSGGSPFMKIDERIQPSMRFAPEVASLNMGSVNFALFPMLERFPNLKHDWERQHLENSRDLIFRNTFKDIEYALAACAAYQTRFEFECYDIGHLYNLAHFAERGLVKAPFFVQSVFGILGGIGTHPEDVAHMRRTADRLFGKDYQWSVLGAGKHQLRIAAMSASMGGNVRVGLEDSLWLGKGTLAKSNADQVRNVRHILEGLGLEIATPDEARQILQLKGADKVKF